MLEADGRGLTVSADDGPAYIERLRRADAALVDETRRYAEEGEHAGS